MCRRCRRRHLPVQTWRSPCKKSCSRPKARVSSDIARGGCASKAVLQAKLARGSEAAPPTGRDGVSERDRRAASQQLRDGGVASLPLLPLPLPNEQSTEAEPRRLPRSAGHRWRPGAGSSRTPALIARDDLSPHGFWAWQLRSPAEGSELRGRAHGDHPRARLCSGGAPAGNMLLQQRRTSSRRGFRDLPGCSGRFVR
eukprot:scaffold10_cov257-Pinguiococcus_pyrenoidosus.AAC.16